MSYSQYSADEEDFSDYDHGYRRGMFDKVNDRKKYDLSGVDPDSIWRAGYEDAWNTYEVRIPGLHT